MAVSTLKMDKILTSLVGAGIGGLIIVKGSAELFPHIYKRFYGLKDYKGAFVTVPDRCLEQLHKVAERYGVTNVDKVNLFIHRGFHAISLGSSLLPGGAVIGLPRWYVFQNKEDIYNSGLNFGKTVGWYSEVGEALSETFLPTDDMIAFTIGHELTHTEKHFHLKLYDTFAPPTWLYVTYRISNSMSKILKHRFDFRALLYLGIFGVSLFTYTRVYEKVCHFAEFDADEVSAKCDPRMARGGVDFFAVTLKRNLIQRAILGKKGEENFTKEGNFIARSLISMHPPFTDRLDRVRYILESSLD